MSVLIDVDNPSEVRRFGFQALTDALGPVGTERFIEQCSCGYGDYTKEKHERPATTINEFETWLKEQPNLTAEEIDALGGI
jgi:hypothetical protein